MDRFRIGILGATTRQGRQLIKLLLSHPISELVAVSTCQEDISLIGTPVSHHFPSLQSRCSLSFSTPEQVMQEADVVFNADPYVDSQEQAAASIRNKCVFLDLAPSFRPISEQEYRQRFGTGFSYPGLHDAAVYGLPELLRDHMAGKVLVGLPGPSATATLLALVPLLVEGLIEPEGIIIDVKMPADPHQPISAADLCAVSDRFDELPEIEQMLCEAAGRTVRVCVSTCRTPSQRGLLVTCTAKASMAASGRTIQTALNGYYSDEQFVTVIPAGTRGASAAAVAGTNLCELSAHFDERTGRVTVCSALDTLMKGSAGQAVQCMNRILSMPEEIGLDGLPFN